VTTQPTYSLSPLLSNYVGSLS